MKARHNEKWLGLIDSLDLRNERSQTFTCMRLKSL